MRYLVILVLFVSIAEGSHLSLPHLLGEITSQYFKCNQVTIIADRFFMKSDELDPFLKNSHLPYVLYEADRAVLAQPKPYYCKNAIILVKEIDQLTEFVSKSQFLKQFYQGNGKICLVSSGDQRKVDRFLQSQSAKDLRHFILVRPLNSVAYEIKTSNNYQETPILLDRWSKTRGFHAGSNLYPDKLKDMQGTQLNVATLNYPPYSTIGESSDGSKSYVGIEHEIVRIIAQAVNVSLTYQEPSPDELWGQLGPNISTGILGMVARRVADVGVANFYQDLSRMQYVDFTVPYGVAYECFATSAAKPLPRWTAIYYPFDGLIWFATFLATVVSLLLLWAVANVFRSESTFRHFSSAFVYIAGNLLQVQQPRDVVAGSIRLVIIWWFVFVTIVPTVYRSVLISFFTQPVMEPAIDTFRQLAASPIEKRLYGVFFKDIMLNSTDPDIRHLGEQVTTHFNITAMLPSVVDGSVAASSGLSNLLYEISTKFAGLNLHEQIHVMRECLFAGPLSFVLPKNSALKLKFDSYIQTIIEAGLVDYQNRLWKRQINAKAIKNNLVPFSLDHLQGAFLLFAIGFCIGFIALLVEVFYFKQRLRKRPSTIVK